MAVVSVACSVALRVAWLAAELVVGKAAKMALYLAVSWVDDLVAMWVVC
jgi:hypothetical protein